MPDAFRELRAAHARVAPDPEFAARLRARVARRLGLPRGVVPMTASADEPTGVTSPRPAAVPYLAVADARGALDWYVEVFGAEVAGEPITMPDGRIGHAELRIGDGLIYLADEHPALGVVAPRQGEASVSLMLPVDEADVVRERAVQRGAIGDREPYDGYGERHAWIVDPFGHRWGLHSPLAAANPFRAGDVGHVSVRVPDPERAASLYAEVLGWTYESRDPGNWVHVADAGLSTGIARDSGDPTLFCVYLVTDLDAAVGRVRAAGGSAGGIEQTQYGRMAGCADDQGVAFRLAEAIGERPGTSRLTYLTLHVVDVDRARAFYGSVLGWGFAPGRVTNGWQITSDTSPMIGLWGGHEHARAVPMWTVPDLDVAIAALRAHGGTAAEPEQQPYGHSTLCTDDQGFEFYLLEP